MRICIVGAGAMGGLYGGAMAEAALARRARAGAINAVRPAFRRAIVRIISLIPNYPKRAGRPCQPELAFIFI